MLKISKAWSVSKVTRIIWSWNLKTVKNSSHESLDSDWRLDLTWSQNLPWIVKVKNCLWCPSIVQQKWPTIAIFQNYLLLIMRSYGKRYRKRWVWNLLGDSWDSLPVNPTFVNVFQVLQKQSFVIMSQHFGCYCCAIIMSL